MSQPREWNNLDSVALPWLDFSQNVFFHCSDPLAEERRPMKEKDAIVDYDGQKVLIYVEKEDGSYGSLTTGAYMPKNYLDDFSAKHKLFEEQSLKLVMDGETSMVAHYMELRNMTPSDVAGRVGVRTSQVKKHMTAGGFGSASLSTVRRYAEVFDVPVAGLFQIPGAARLSHNPTKNPFVTTVGVQEQQ
jgi:hypothetical protein